MENQNRVVTYRRNQQPKVVHHYHQGKSSRCFLFVRRCLLSVRRCFLFLRGCLLSVRGCLLSERGCLQLFCEGIFHENGVCYCLVVYYNLCIDQYFIILPVVDNHRNQDALPDSEPVSGQNNPPHGYTPPARSFNQFVGYPPSGAPTEYQLSPRPHLISPHTSLSEQQQSTVTFL